MMAPRSSRSSTSSGRSGACCSDGPVSGAGVLPQESSPGMLKVKNTSQKKCFSKCSLKDHLAFIFKRHSLSVHLPDSTSRSLPFFLSPLCIFWIHLLQDCYPFSYFHHEMMGKSINQFWRTSDDLKPRVCSTKVKQRNQRIQNMLTL